LNKENREGGTFAFPHLLTSPLAFLASPFGLCLQKAREATNNKSQASFVFSCARGVTEQRGARVFIMNFIQIRTTGQQIRIKKVKINVKTNATEEK
jgi:hypothetical protein